MSAKRIKEASMAQSSVVGVGAKKTNGHKKAKGAPQSQQHQGVSVTRRFTQPGVDPLASGSPGENGEPLVYERRSSVITNPDGTIVFKMDNAEVPRAGASSRPTSSSPSTSARPASTGDKDRARSVQQVVQRVAHTIRTAGERVRRLLRHEGRRRHLREPSSRTSSSTSTARSTRPCGSTAASSHEYGIEGSRRQLGLERRHERTRSSETEERLRAPAVLGVLHPVGQATTSCRSTTSSRARRASSSTARARARTSARSAASRRSSRAAARRAAS